MHLLVLIEVIGSRAQYTSSCVSMALLAYNLGNFMRRLTLPESAKHWSLRSVQTKLIKMGGRLMRHARRLVFQLAEVAVAREVFRQALERLSAP